MRSSFLRYACSRSLPHAYAFCIFIFTISLL